MQVLVVQGAVDSAGWICETLDAAGFESRCVAPAAALREFGVAMPAVLVVDLAVPAVEPPK